MTVHRFDAAQLARTPWKNGGGVTREIVCQPAGAGFEDFDWRVSLAEIVGDGPFSTFEGVDRVITLLDGNGVCLHGAGAAIDHRLDRPLAPFGFAGEAPVHAELLDGPCLDLNVMTRRARCRAQIEVVRSARALPAAAHGLLLAVRGRWKVRTEGTAAHAVPERGGLWWTAPSAWWLQSAGAGGVLLAVLIQPSTR